MKLATRLLSATALAILPASALYAADDNVAHIDQIGADNAALIDQVGARNSVGLEDDAALQNGYYNALTVRQTGADNRVGTEGDGLEQNGQLASPSVHNIITIEQSSSENIVGEVLQSALGAIPGEANRLIVLQEGDKGNRVSVVYQIQENAMPGQIADITQSGEGNQIALLRQRSISSKQDGENTITARFSGDFNGLRALTGPALISGVPDAALIQDTGANGLGANGNQIDVAVTGGFNGFGIYQGGELNSVGLITITGDSNELGIRQDGYENDLTTSVISGDQNRIGIDQMGTNRAFLDLVGQSDDNDILGIQIGTNDLRFYVEGDRNRVSAKQDYDSGMGGGNAAEFRVIGSDNVFDLLQEGTNTATFTVEGDFNNNSGAILAGDAAIGGLVAGVIRQVGTGNAIEATITGDANLLAALQTGASNTFVAVISGKSNQAALVQDGTLNTAYLAQTGNGNIAGIIQ